MNSLALAPDRVDRLVKLCGMLGSAHAGERANAAERADRLVRDAGLTWRDVLAREQPTPQLMTDEAGLAFCAMHLDLLTDWERRFVLDVMRRGRALSEKQRAVLHRLLNKLRAAA